MFTTGIFLMLITVGLVPIGTQVAEGGSWGAAPCIGGLFVVAGVLGLLERALTPRLRRRHHDLPTTPASPGSEVSHGSR